jgi:hypothetical protein
MAISVAFGQITQCERKFGETETAMSWGTESEEGGSGERGRECWVFSYNIAPQGTNTPLASCIA